MIMSAHTERPTLSLRLVDATATFTRTSAQCEQYVKRLQTTFSEDIQGLMMIYVGSKRQKNITKSS